MQEVMTCDPERIVEIQVIESAIHYTVNGLGGEITAIDKVSDGKEEQGKVRRYRSPQKSGLGKFVFFPEFLFDGGVDDEVRWNSIQVIPLASKVRSLE